jgi:hypothetical protein
LSKAVVVQAEIGYLPISFFSTKPIWSMWGLSTALQHMTKMTNVSVQLIDGC